MRFIKTQAFSFYQEDTSIDDSTILVITFKLLHKLGTKYTWSNNFVFFETEQYYEANIHLISVNCRYDPYLFMSGR